MSLQIIHNLWNIRIYIRTDKTEPIHPIVNTVLLSKDLIFLSILCYLVYLLFIVISSTKKEIDQKSISFLILTYINLSQRCLGRMLNVHPYQVLLRFQVNGCTFQHVLNELEHQSSIDHR